MAQTNSNIIKSAAKFLQTPAQPERPLEEKIRFLIKEKKLTQYQLIAALKQANLYSIDTIEPILNMHYFEQNEKKNSNKKKKKDKNETRKQQEKQESSPNNPSQQQHQQAAQQSSSWSSWWSTATSIGIGLASFVASYTVSTTASQKIVKTSEEKTIKKLDVVKTEIKEQADLDRERQHRDLMEVVNLLKTQVQCVQQNLGVLKQSIDVIQTQMKFNNNNNSNNNMNNNMNINVNNPNTNNSIHSKLKTNNNANDDGTNSIISSNLSMHNESKPNLGVIGNLLSKNDDGLEWMDENIIIPSDVDKNDDENDKNNDDQIDNKQSQNNNDDDIDKNIGNDNNDEKEEKEEEIVLIYHPDYKDMIKTLPTDITEIKHQLTDLLNLWQKMVNKAEKNKDNSSDNNDDKDLNIDKIKAGVNALNMYINKILKQPFMERPRKINTFNKQYKERLSNLPRIDELFTVIGFEKNENGIFWILPLLYDNKDSSNSDDDKDKKKQIHDKQIQFLESFKSVLSNLFKTSDDTLPFNLIEGIQKIKEEREEKLKQENQDNVINNEQEEKKENVGNDKENQDISNVNNMNMDMMNINNGNNIVTNTNTNNIITNTNSNANDSINNVPETKYSNKFMEIAQMVQQGKTPDDVKKIDDMPPDPNAPPSESKLAQQRKPFENNDDQQDNNNNNDNSNDDNNNNAPNWFDQYERDQ